MLRLSEPPRHPTGDRGRLSQLRRAINGLQRAYEARWPRIDWADMETTGDDIGRVGERGQRDRDAREAGAPFRLLCPVLAVAPAAGTVMCRALEATLALCVACCFLCRVAASAGVL